MSKDVFWRKKKKVKMDQEDLSSCFNKLSFDEVHNYAPIATNEYYYALALNDVEKRMHLPRNFTANKAQTSAVASSEVVKESPKKKKKKDKVDRVTEKVESITGKLKNLTVTVQNDPPKSPAAAKNQSPAKKTKDKDSKNLLEQLKMLQSGKITSEKIVSSHKSPLKKKKESNEATAEEKLETLVNSVSDKGNLKLPKMMTTLEKRRAEVEELNRQIQEKINRIRPRLKKIINMKSPPSSSPSSVGSSQSIQPVLPKLRIPTSAQNNFTCTTTQVGDHEIYRYTSNELCQMQQLGTWQQLPSLLQLNICGTQLSPLDDFIIRLVESSAQQRNELILNKAQERNFITRTGPSEFVYNRPNFNPESVQQQPQQQQQVPAKINEPKKMQIMDYVERYRLIAKSDEELNKLIYQHEFKLLFETAFKDQDAFRNKTITELANHLLETRQAYLIEGEIRVNQRNNQEAYISNIKGMKDVCVSNLTLRKHSFHGDIVRVLVRNDGNGNGQQEATLPSPEIIENDLIEEIPSECRNFGVVLDILERRHSRRVLGTFAPFTNIKKSRKHLMVMSRDPKVPNIRINTRTGLPTDTELSDKLVIAVEIIAWSHDQPFGKVVSIIGKKGELKTENAAILQQNNLDPKPFEQYILDQLPSEPFEIPAEEFQYRADLRKKCIFSIDPETARDLDDALSCEVLPNGNYEVGVHISDVSYFVKEDSDLDRIVRQSATTIYLVDQVYHMLPEKLCLMCSLLPGADKMAYSVFFEMNPSTAKIHNVRYIRSVVNSCGKLSYDHAQMVIDKKHQNWSSLENDFPELYNGFTVAQVADVITKLQSLAVMMRANRKANGALKIDQPKLSFQFGKSDQRMEAPIDFFKYCTKDSNQLIEEFMLLANISVATFINEKYPEVSLLRQHGAPNESAMKKLTKLLNKNGIQLDTSSSSALSRSMEDLISTAKHPNGMNAAINMMVSKTMTRAKYFCNSYGENESDFWHYALSIPIYTHFTSPIRRYADILVHRALNAALGYEELTSKSPDEIQHLAEICNVQKYNAKLAGDDSSNLYFMHFIQSLKSKTMMAAVLGIFEFNLEVILVDTGHVIKVYYKNLQQSDDVVIKTFIDNSPPYVTFHHPKNQSAQSLSTSSPMKIEFGMEILVQVEVMKDKLIANKIFYNQ